MITSVLFHRLMWLQLWSKVTCWACFWSDWVSLCSTLESAEFAGNVFHQCGHFLPEFVSSEWISFWLALWICDVCVCVCVKPAWSSYNFPHICTIEYRNLWNQLKCDWYQLLVLKVKLHASHLVLMSEIYEVYSSFLEITLFVFTLQSLCEAMGRWSDAQTCTPFDQGAKVWVLSEIIFSYTFTCCLHSRVHRLYVIRHHLQKPSIENFLSAGLFNWYNLLAHQLCLQDITAFLFLFKWRLCMKTLN